MRPTPRCDSCPPADGQPTCAEVEEGLIDELGVYVQPLYIRSLRTDVRDVDGLDEYLTDAYLAIRPATFAAALSRLRMAWCVAADLSRMDPPEPESQGAKVQVCASVPLTH